MMRFTGNPFVGLRPFESDESLLFFGRQKQIMELLERLHRHQFVAITGSSGCGKSSLIRAGLIPKLKAGYLVEDRDEWIISVMKPGDTPFLNMAAAILEQVGGPERSADELQKKIRERGTDVILEILNPFFEKNFNFFLLVDQFEELFSYENQVKSDATDEAVDFVNILLELSAQMNLPVYVIITMRSDYIGDCAQFYGLPEALNQSQYVVPKLSRLQLRAAIEGPVLLTETKIHPGLIERLLNDSRKVKVELPLLQHLLLRIWEREKNIHRNGELDLEDYYNIGGIDKALSRHAKEALEGMNEEQKKLTKKIFQSLTRIDEKGRKARRRVHLSELEKLTDKKREEILFIIQRFNEDGRSFLTVSNIEETDDLLIDLSHESLISQWETLNHWVDEEAESARVFLRLAESAVLYTKGDNELLQGNQLHTISHWFHSFKPGAAWAHRYSPDFDVSAKYLDASEQQEKKQIRRRRLNRRLRFASVLFVALLVSAFAVMLFIHNIKRKRELVQGYWNSSQASRSSNDPLVTLHLVAEALDLNDDKKMEEDLLIDGQNFLPQTRLASVIPYHTIINSISFDAGDKLMLVAGNDNTVSIIDRETGRQLKVLRHEAPVNSAGFNIDQQLIITASNDRTVCIWDAVTGERRYCIEFPAAVTSAVFSKDGKNILLACADSVARTVNTGTRAEALILPSLGSVTSAVYSADEKQIVTASTSGDVDIWNASGQKIHSFQHNKAVNSAVFSPDGKEVLTSCDDGYAYTWDIAAGTQTGTFRHEGNVTGAVFSPGGRWIVTTGRDKLGRLWDASSKRLVTVMQDEGPLYAAVFSANEKWIATGGWAKTIKVWELADAGHTPSAIPFNFNSKVNKAFFGPDDQSILVVTDDQYAYIIDTATRKQRSLVHNDTIVDAAFHAGSLTLFTATADSTIHIWNVNEEQQKVSLKLNANVPGIALSPNGKWILAIMSDNYVRIWDRGKILTRNCIDSFRYSAEIVSVAITADNKKILIAGTDSVARLIDVATRQEIHYFKHDDIVNGAVFSPDEKYILTCSQDQTAILWDIKTGLQTGSPMKHEGFVNSAVFSPDGRWILTADFAKSSHLWSRTTLKKLGSGFSDSGHVFRADFSHNGRAVINTGQTSIWINELEADLDMPADLFKLQALAVTGTRYDLETNQTKCIAPGEWILIKEQYERKAKEHLEVCKYRRYNLWDRFN